MLLRFFANDFRAWKKTWREKPTSLLGKGEPQVFLCFLEVGYSRYQTPKKLPLERQSLTLPKSVEI